jgi:hypothetical protein
MEIKVTRISPRTNEALTELPGKIPGTWSDFTEEINRDPALSDYKEYGLRTLGAEPYATIHVEPPVAGHKVLEAVTAVMSWDEDGRVMVDKVGVGDNPPHVVGMEGGYRPEPANTAILAKIGEVVVEPGLPTHFCEPIRPEENYSDFLVAEVVWPKPELDEYEELVATAYACGMPDPEGQVQQTFAERIASNIKEPWPAGPNAQR